MAGTCKLCLKTKELQQSHLLPAAAYKHLRGNEIGNENPVFVSNANSASKASMVQTSEQIQDYVLCWDCEQILRSRGEDWVLRRLAVGEASPLYHALQHAVPTDTRSDFTCSTLGNPEFDIGQIAHFALGVFFKMAAYEWRIGRKLRKFEFGPYLEQIRLYLLGEGPFPADASLIFCIHPPTTAPKRIVVPYEWEKSECRTYGFIVIGLEFALGLGRRISRAQRQLCFVTGSQHLVVVANVTEKSMNDAFDGVVRAGRAKGKLASRLNRNIQKR